MEIVCKIKLQITDQPKFGQISNLGHGFGDHGQAKPALSHWVDRCRRSPCQNQARCSGLRATNLGLGDPEGHLDPDSGPEPLDWPGAEGASAKVKASAHINLWFLVVQNANLTKIEKKMGRRRNRGNLYKNCMFLEFFCGQSSTLWAAL